MIGAADVRRALGALGEETTPGWLLEKKRVTPRPPPPPAPAAPKPKRKPKAAPKSSTSDLGTVALVAFGLWLLFKGAR